MNTYIINSVSRCSDGNVYISGTVNGVYVSCSCTQAQFNTFPSTSTQLAFIQGLMLSAYNLQNLTPVPGVTGTFQV